MTESKDAPASNSEDRDPIEELLDLAVYAPLGLALEFRRLLPELAARGRKQLEFARSIGKAASGGMSRASAAPTAAKKKPTANKTAPPSPASTKKKSSAKKPAAKKKPASKKTPAAKKSSAKKKPAAKKSSAKKKPASKKTPAAKKAAAAKSDSVDVTSVIENYDTMSARELMPRLAELSADERAAVKVHERTGRNRVTVLNKLAALDAAS